MTISAEQLDRAVAAVRSRWKDAARVGLILGTGLGALARHIQADAIIPYGDIPHFPRTSALSHRGLFVCGSFCGKSVVAMEGRAHVYEGHAVDSLTLGVRVMRALGADLLIVSNAAGGLNPQYRPGELMMVEDHIDLMFRQLPRNPLRNPHPRSVVRQTTSPYDTDLIAQAMSAARRENIAAHQGVYVAVTGPNYETRAEYRFLRQIGGDAVGMSTVPEAIVAAQLGMRVLALSTITNVATPDLPQKVEGSQVVAMAEQTEPNLRKIVESVIGGL